MASEAPCVLFVTRKWAPAVGGIETYCLELTQELGAIMEVDIIALQGRSDGSPPSAIALMLFPFRVAWRYMRRARSPEILHIGDMASWPLALLALLRPARPAVILSAHGTDVSYHRRKGVRGRLYEAYMRLGAALLRSARIIANSAATARAAAETGWSASNVVPLATRVAAAAPPQAHGNHILFAGRLVERKGCRWFARNVLPLLPPEIGLKVCGPVWDKPEGEVLNDPRVEYLGILHGEDLLAAYRSALCVVVPNIEPQSGEFEGFGLIATEAAAAGGLLLAADIGGLTEAVIPDETGYLLPSGKPEAWKLKINEIATWSDDHRRAFVGRAMIRAREHYSWSRVADEVVTIYHQAIAHRQRRLDATIESTNHAS